jgi:Spy/CpxP family protein refolding chaperone
MAVLMCAMSTLLVAKPVFAQEAAPVQEQDVQQAMTPEAFDILLAVTAPSEGFAFQGDSVAVGAGGDSAAMGPKGGWHHEGPLSGANALTDDQCERLYSLHNQFLDSQGPKMAKLGALHRQLKDSLASANFDAKRSADLGSQINALKSEIDAAKMDRLIASAQVLTSEQRHALHEHMIRHSAMLPGLAGPLGHEHGGHGHEHGEHHHGW